MSQPFQDVQATEDRILSIYLVMKTGLVIHRIARQHRGVVHLNPFVW
jgi:hypothetical protein